MSYADRVHECDQCHLVARSEPGELLPDAWQRTSGGAVVCSERCLALLQGRPVPRSVQLEHDESAGAPGGLTSAAGGRDSGVAPAVRTRGELSERGGRSDVTPQRDPPASDRTTMAGTEPAAPGQSESAPAPAATEERS